MVDVQFSLKQSSLNKLSELISRLAGRRIRNNFGDLRPLISDEIDKQITKNRNRFIPSDEEAAELGVGEGGAIDRNKTNLAWTALLVGDRELSGGARVTTFSVRKIGTERGKVVGQVSININEDNFFNAPRSNVDTPNSDEIDSIPWMRWFIQGATIGGARFSNKEPVPETSRTGRGIMVEGGLWRFTPRGLSALQVTSEDVRLGVRREIKKNGAKILRRRR